MLLCQLLLLDATVNRTQVSSVGLETRLHAVQSSNWGSVPSKHKWVWVGGGGVKQPGHEADRSTPSSVKVNNA
jgi:hypothetical protein